MPTKSPTLTDIDPNARRHDAMGSDYHRTRPTPPPGSESGLASGAFCDAPNCCITSGAGSSSTTPGACASWARMKRMLDRRLILVKHALPELQAGLAPRHWQLGAPGREGAKRLSEVLRRLGPLRLEHSPEPKAAQTAALVAAELGLGRHERRGLEEIDRAPQPILSRDSYIAHNARLFAEPTHAVVGTEPAELALSRFNLAIDAAVSATSSAEHLAVITHGTVIALFVAAYNPVDALSLWQRLSCPALVLLSIPDHVLLEVRDTI